MNREERTKRFKSLSSRERQKLILKKMKAKGIEVGSGVPNKRYDNEIEKSNLSKTFFIPRIIILYINFLIAKKNSWYDKLYFEKHFDNNVHIQPTFFNDLVNFIFKKKDESLFSTKKNLL